MSVLIPFLSIATEPKNVISYMLLCKKNAIEWMPIYDSFTNFVREAILNKYITSSEYYELFGNNPAMLDAIFTIQYGLEDRCLVDMEKFLIGSPEWKSLQEKTSVHASDCARIVTFMKVARLIELDESDDEDPVNDL